MKKAIIFLSLALGLFVLFQFARYLFFNAPLRSILAAIKYEEYRQAQGIDARLIQSKKVLVDYKSGIAFVKVLYKDDPDHVYEYHYALYIANLKHPYQKHSFHKMRLVVSTSPKATAELNEKALNSQPKYKPLDIYNNYV